MPPIRLRGPAAAFAALLLLTHPAAPARGAEPGDVRVAAMESARPMPRRTSTAPDDPPSCLRVVWNPPVEELCAANWGIQAAAGSRATPEQNRRYSCESMDGEPVLAIVSHGGVPNSLIEYAKEIKGSDDFARLTAQMFIPRSYRPYTSGRLAFGLLIGDRTCASGGCLPAEQTGAMVRANFAVSDAGTSIVLADYSYHLDRSTRARMIDSSWEGGVRRERAFGAGRSMKRQLPKGQWVTLQLDVGLNTPGKADGFSRLSAFDAKGNLIGSAGYDNVIYRPDASWTISGPAMTEKYNDNGPGPKDQTIYYRDFRLETGMRAACGE